MKISSLFVPVSAAFLVAGCGARTGEDDLLYFSLNGDGDAVSTGGGRPTGGAQPGGGSGGMANTGGRFSTGGVPAVGGGFVTGGAFPSGGSPPLGDCCEPSPFPECADDAVVSCVCAKDSFCCDNYWDGQCVQVADESCRAGCSGTGGGGSGGGGTGGSAAGGTGAGGSGGSSAGGTGGVGGSPGDCCAEHDGQGCSDMRITSCVCEQDAFCCENSWDSLCANQAEDDCEAMCTPGSGGSGTGGSSSGGATGAGGSVATGGTGGGVSEICEFAFGNNSCSTCVCLSCFDELSGCVGDASCAAIAACIITEQCTDAISCLEPQACGREIEAAGGLLSASVLKALQLGLCYVESTCDCP